MFVLCMVIWGIHGESCCPSVRRHPGSLTIFVWWSFPQLYKDNHSDERGAISETYDSVRLKCIYQTRKVPVKSSKDVLPTLCKSNVIYLFVCQCEKAYVGRTTQSLKTRVDQHVPIGLRSKISNNLPLPKTAPSSIAQHLLENKACALKFSTNCFSILAYARNDFHLSILEAIFISTLNPDLCKQKKFVLPLRIFR